MDDTIDDKLERIRRILSKERSTAPLTFAEELEALKDRSEALLNEPTASDEEHHDICAAAKRLLAENVEFRRRFDMAIRLSRVYQTARGFCSIFKPTPFPRIWELMGYLLPPKFHDRIWTPAIEDQKRKYYEARKKYRTRGAHIFLWFAFFFRTIMMLPECYRLMGLAKIQRFFELAVPETVKRWWIGL